MEYRLFFWGGGGLSWRSVLRRLGEGAGKRHVAWVVWGHRVKRSKLLAGS